MKKILIVFGTRPEAIKMVSVVRAFTNSLEFNCKVCVTGQHRELLDQVLELFEIKPDFDLNVMKNGQDLYDTSSRIILGMRDVLREFGPDVVLVHGDTTTSSMAALASFYEQIPVGHVEAGLRTNHIYSPWPEEMNRQITGRIATFHFAPTVTAKNNLVKENTDKKKIVVTGNTVIDTLLLALEKIKNNKKLCEKVKIDLKEKNGLKFSLENTKNILVTGHRRESFGEGFLNICRALKEIALKYKNCRIIYPVHLNPNVRKPVYSLLQGVTNIHLVEPLEYLPFIYLMSHSYLILTDSGGIQEEAPGLGKPVLLMRDTTERPEAVESGTVKLVGTKKNMIVSEVSKLMTDENCYREMAVAGNIYGDGKACERIVKYLQKELVERDNIANE
ncbi:MAG: UDP-N-acetylglucosamine 2-epimerase (non-hydrolyzing) [bacterium]|nr:UDP-N-acetylglucosamine 2-epimerase (non-hydrolyzing) [bacterium]